MVDNSFSFLAGLEVNKNNDIASASLSKYSALGDVSNTKKQYVSNLTNTPAIQQINEWVQKPVEKETPIKPVESLYDESLGKAFVRGIRESIDQIPMTGYGLLAGGGAIAEKVAGSGGLATKLKKFAVDKYSEIERDMSEHSQPTDSFTTAYNRAKDGDVAALIDWVSHGSGYVTGQLASLLVGAGIIEKGAELVTKKAATKVIGGLVRKEAQRIAAKTAQKAASDAVLKEATANVAKSVGQKIGMASVSFGLEGGEIMGTLAKQSTEENRTLTGKEIAKGLSATAIAGAIEYLELGLATKALKGKFSKLPVADLKKVSGIGGKLGRAGATALQTAPLEGAQEFAQTGVEQWGTGKKLNTKEAATERFDALMLGALGAGPTSIVNLASRSTSEQEKAIEKNRIKVAEREKYKAQTSPDFKNKVAEATQDITKFVDPKSKDYSPRVVVEALKNNSITEDSVIKKISNFDQAQKVRESLEQRQVEIVDKVQTLTANKESKDLTDKEVVEVTELLKERTNNQKLIEEIDPIIESLNVITDKAASPELLTKLNKVIKETNNKGIVSSIIEVYGSSNDIVSLGNKVDLDSVLRNPDINSATKKFINRIKQLEVSAQELESYSKEATKVEGKTTGEVYSDILYGGPGFKGINNYVTAISNAVSNKDNKVAKNQLDQLKQFTNQKVIRTETFKKAQDATLSNNKLNNKDQANLDQYNKIRLSKGQEPYVFGPAFEKSIKAMALETQALKAAVALSNELVSKIETSKPTVIEKSNKQLEQMSVIELDTERKKTKSKEYIKRINKIGKKAKDKLLSFSVEELKKELTNTKDIKYQKILKKQIILKEKTDAQTKPTIKEKPVISEVVSVEPTKKSILKEILTTATKDTDIDNNNNEDINKINIVNEFFIPTGDKPNIFNKGFDFIEVGFKQLEKNKAKLEPDTFKMYKSLLKFNQKFQENFNKIYKIKDPNFAYQDPLSYLVIDGKLPNNVISAMSAVAFKWIATRGYETTINDDKQIAGILGLPNDTLITENARKLLGNIGQNSTYLSEILGREFLKLIQIKAGPDAPISSQQSIENAAGNSILATLQQLNYVDRFYVDGGIKLSSTTKEEDIPGIMDGATTGFFGLKNNVKENSLDDIAPENFFIPFESIGTPARKGTVRYDFFVLKTENGKLIKETAFIKDTFKQAKNVWENIYGLPKDTDNYSWSKFNFDNSEEQFTTKNGKKVSIEQTQNLKRSINKPFEISVSMLNLVSFLDKESRYVVSGKKDTTNSHVETLKNKETTNNAIERSYEALNMWLHDSFKTKNGYKSKFYIPAVFQDNQRMRQVGNIQPQNDKIHRALFKMSDWGYSIDLQNSDEKEITKEEFFLLSVGQSLGIETSKETTTDNTLDKIIDLLNTEVMQEALVALDVFLDLNKDLNTFEPVNLKKLREDNKNLIDSIVAGVKAGGEDLHTLKGLIEYTRYQRALKNGDKSFFTDLYIEIDGIANGPTIGSIQMLYSDITPEKLGILQSEGLVFQKPDDIPKGVHRASYDPYESIGAYWGNLLAVDKEILSTNIVTEENSKKDLQYIVAAEQLIGKLYDNQGYLGKTVRKLAKNRSVGAFYGSGAKSINKALLHTVLIEDSIYGNLEKIVQIDDSNERQAALDALRFNVNTLAGIDQQTVLRPLKATKKNILNLKVPTSIISKMEKNLSKHYGATLVKAIRMVYGDMQKVRAPLNKSISILTAQYNIAQKVLIEERKKDIAKQKNIKIQNIVLTNKDLQSIRKELSTLLPEIQTPMSNYMALYDFIPSFEEIKTQNKMIQSYKKQGTKYIPPLTTHIKGIHNLKEPGVKPIATTIHMLDAMVANSVIGNKQNIGVLNVHDGEILSVDRVQELSSNISNKVFYDLMENYSIVDEFNEVYLRTTEAYQNFIDKYPKAHLLEQETFKSMKLVNKKERTASEVKDNNRKERLQQRDTVNKNKDTVLSAVTIMDQMFLTSGAGYKTGNKVQENINNIPVDNIVPESLKIKNDRASFNIKATDVLIKNTENGNDLQKILNIPITEKELKNLGSYVDPDNNILSLDPTEYETIQEINRQNAVEVFNLLETDSIIKSTPEHSKYLTNVLDSLVSKVLQPVDLYLKSNPDVENTGKFVTDNKTKEKILITKQVPVFGPVSGLLSQGIRMSTGEVYTHELIHAITHTGLKLNHKVRGQVEKLYQLAYKKLDYKAFLIDPTIDVNDPANKYEIEAAQQRYDYLFRTPSVRSIIAKDGATGIENVREYSNHLDEFIACGLTNANFISALKQVPLESKEFNKNTWAGIKGANIQETVLNIANIIYEFLFTKFNTKKVQKNIADQLNILARTLSQVDSQHKSIIAEKIQFFDKAYGSMADKANKFIKGLFTPVKKLTDNLRQIENHLQSQDSLLGQNLRDIKNKYQKMDYGIIKSTITEIKGNTERVAWLHNLLNRRKIFLDESKETISSNYTESAKNLFKEELTTQEKTTVTKIGLKTDLTSILDTFGLNRIKEFLTDSNALNQAITDTNDKIKADTDLQKYKTYYNNVSDSLGYYMVHGRARGGIFPFLSTKVIASLKNTKYEGNLSDVAINRAELLVEELATLYALKYSTVNQKNIFARLIDRDPKGVNGVLRMHQILKEDSLEQAFNGNKYLFEKGYIKNILNTRINFKYGTIEDEKQFSKEGFIRSIRPIDRDNVDPTNQTDMYIYTAKTGRINDLVSMILSYTGNRSKGIDSIRIAQQLDKSTKEGAANNRKIIKNKQRIIDAMFNDTYKPNKRSGNYMIPQVDINGNISKYRYVMSETTKDVYLEQVHDYDMILGGMAGQIIDKVRTPTINEELVDGLYAMYQQEYQNNPENYLKVGPDSADPKLQEIYYMIPEKTKQYIQSVWGTPYMYVAKDTLAISFGFRQYSIVEAFIKNPNERALLEKAIVNLFNFIAKDYGVIIANNIEQVAFELTKMAKDNIIIKSLYITLDNFGSNLIYLKSRGVSTLQIVKQSAEAIKHGIKYQADKQKLDQLITKQRLLLKDNKNDKDLDLQIVTLKNSIALNPATKTIEAGLMPSLVDDVDTNISKSHFPTEIEKMIDKTIDKLPTYVQNVGKTLFLTHGTQGYKILNNAVKMTDYVGRYVLYNYYIDKKRGTDIMTHEKAIESVIEEFVNFNLPTHRMVEYGNKIGLLWFTKYGLRILKVIYESVIDKPFNVITAYLLSSHIGLDNINNSIPGVTKDILTPLSNPVSAITSSADSPFTIDILKSLFNR
jgi:hypothetical protein